MSLKLLTAVVFCLGVAEGQLLGAGVGKGSCSAPPFRAKVVENWQGCPSSTPCCNEYGFCRSEQDWLNGQFRDCNRVSNGAALPQSVINAEKNAARSGDRAGLRFLVIPRQFFGGVLGGISSGINGILHGTGQAVGGIINGAGNAVGGIASGVGGAIGGVASGVGGAVGGVASGVGSGIGGVASGVGGAVGGVASGVGGAVGGVASGVGSGIGGVASGVGQGVGGVASGVGGAVGGVASGVGNTVGGTVSGVGSAIGGAANGGQQWTSGVSRPVYRPTSIYYKNIQPVIYKTVSTRQICRGVDGYYYC